MKKNKKIILAGILSLVALFFIVIAVLHFSGVNLPFLATTVPSGSYIQVPTFMYYECAPSGSKVTGTFNYLRSDGAYISCPENADTCDLDLRINEDINPILKAVVLRTKICTGNVDTCTALESQTVQSNQDNGVVIRTFNNIRKDQYLYVHFQYTSAIPLLYWDYDKGQVRANYNPFILWKTSVLQGGRIEYSSIDQGCIFTSANSQNLLNSVSNLVGISIPTQSSSSNIQLEPYKTRNFVDGFVSAPTPSVNFVTYNGKQGYCLNRQIFAISEVTTNYGTYKIVDTNFNTRLSNSVTCCPGETEPSRKCNSNYQWENIEQAECSILDPCGGSDWSPSGSPKTLIRYNCINSKCIGESKVVECTSNSDCAGNPKGSVCDTKDYICVNISPPLDTCPTSCSIDSECSVCSTVPGEYKCSNNKCVRDITLGEGLCTDCFDWASNLFKAKANECTATESLTVTWYNPISWLGKLTGLTNQNITCPLFYLFLGVVLIIILILTGWGYLIILKTYQVLGFKKAKSCSSGYKLKDGKCRRK